MSSFISGVYEIRNTLNRHCYVGSAININRRWARHKRELRSGIHKNNHLQKAWNKYGESAFSFSVMQEVDKENLIIAEQKFIDEFRPEYNISPTAGSRLGCIHLEETKQKISNSHMGLRPSEETRNKLILSHLGFEITDATKQKMSEASKGKYRGWADKTISQYDKNGKLVNTFFSVMAAERSTGIGNSKIVRCAKGKRKSAGGFTWKYANNSTRGA